jgi:hypothetical protein
MQVITVGDTPQQPALPKKEKPAESEDAQRPPTADTLAMPLLAEIQSDVWICDMGVYRTLRPALFLLEAMMMFVLPACEVHSAGLRMWQYVKMIIIFIIVLMCSWCVCTSHIL